MLGDAAAVEDAIAAWFGLDAEGRRALQRLRSLPVTLDLDQAAELLRRWVPPRRSRARSG